MLTLDFPTFSPECKLSRLGPPATIVAIDEESPNGKYELFNFPRWKVDSNRALQPSM